MELQIINNQPIPILLMKK